LVSQTGKDWKTVFTCTPHRDRKKFHSVIYSELLEIFVAVGDLIYFSKNGINWSEMDKSKYPVQLTGISWLNFALFDKKRLMVTGNFNKFWYTDNLGISWNSSSPN